MMLINIRSTNGGGKSTVVRNLFAEGKVRPIKARLGPRLPEAYELTLPKCKPTFVLGPYETVCGGCDRLIPFDLIPVMISEYAKKGHVIFEGVIISSVFGQVGTLMEQHGKDAVMLFLDTSLEECINRVQNRRDGRDDDRDFDPSNLALKYRSNERVKEKVKAAGIIKAVTANSTDAHKIILKLLQGNGRGRA